MSALFPCPHCGSRPVNEFRYAAEAPFARPAADETLDADGLADRLYNADNPRGPTREWWQHVVGCRTWFVLERDTSRDAVVGAQS